MLGDKEGTSCVMGKLVLRSFLPCILLSVFTCVLGQGQVVLSLSHPWTHLPKVLIRCAQMC